MHNHLFIFKTGIPRYRMFGIRALLFRGDNVTLRQIRENTPLDGENFDNIFIEECEEIKLLSDDMLARGYK